MTLLLKPTLLKSPIDPDKSIDTHTQHNQSLILIMSSSGGLSSKSSSHRPKLARASATAPSLATSNASRQDLANLQSTGASALLSRVASYSVGPDHAHHSHSYSPRYSSPSSLSSSPEQSPASETRKEPYEVANYYCRFDYKMHTEAEALTIWQQVITSASQALRISRTTKSAANVMGDPTREFREWPLHVLMIQGHCIDER